jgi:hypothetical protein
MGNWENRFVEKLEGLRERAVKSFECFADETVQPVYEQVAEFTARHDLQSSAPQRQKGLRSFKFALSESAYILCVFRPKGVAEVEFEHEGYVPRRGQLTPVRSTTALAHAGPEWIEGCFQKALDSLLDEFASSARHEAPAEAVTV